MYIDDLTDTLAQSIYGCGFLSVAQIANCDLETLSRIPGFAEEEAADSLRERAKVAIQKLKDNPIPKEEEEDPKRSKPRDEKPGSSEKSSDAKSASTSEKSSKSSGGAKKDADARLKEAFAEATESSSSESSES